MDRPDVAIADKRGREHGGIGRFFTGLLVFCLVLALAAAVAYLVSERNQRHYRMRNQGGVVFVERGRLFPVGFEPFVPEAKDLQAAYAPLKVPTGERVDEVDNFDDRTDLDRALFGLLAGWARARLQASDAESFDLANGYVSRCSLLPGLSEEQRSELKSLRADLAYRNGRRIASTIADDLIKAAAEFKLALELGTSRPNDARAWATTMDTQVAAYHDAVEERTHSATRASEPEHDRPQEQTPTEKPSGEAL